MRVWMLVLLVVLIFVVAAFLLPILARDRGSRKATCISNVKQLELACIMYAQDYDPLLAKPPHTRPPGSSSPRGKAGLSEKTRHNH